MNPRSPGGLAGLTFLQGGGEMGARMREHDWAATSLGPVEAWPQSLRSTVSMLLPSKAQIIVFWGSEFTVLYNDAYRPVFGAKHPRALGLPGREAWSEIWDSVLHGLLGEVVRTGEAFWAKDLLFELERYGFPEETYFDVSYDPVRVESGNVGGVYCIVTETTERVIGERRMALLKNLAGHNGTARTQRDACHLATETLAADGRDVTFALTYLDDELQSCTPGAEQKLADEAGLLRELPLPAFYPGARGGRLVMGVNPKRPLDDQYRSFLDLVADQVATAIANASAYEQERTRAEALAQLDRAKTVFFSNVSHEFRTPLALMLGPTEEALASPERSLSGDALEIVHRNELRLLKLVNTLLDFSRIEAGRSEANRVPSDLATFTADIASTFRSAFDRAGLEFVVECPPLPHPVSVDHEMWEKIVLNLLSNALKFTMDGSVRLSLRERDGLVELRVADTGVGIPESDLAHVFERFHRVQGTRARTHEGSGIGLALVNELVKLHGGSLDVTSEIEKGTTFTATIPAGVPEAAREIALQAPVAGGSARLYVTEAMRWMSGRQHTPRVEPARSPDARRIVVADDNADMRDYLHRLLGDRWLVETHEDGQSALDAARANPPTLVIADVMMPRLDGFELLRELQADPRTAGVPVILLSARAGEEAKVEGLHAGAVDYLVKPFSARELRARVDAQVLRAEIRAAQELQVKELAAARREAESANRAKDEFIAMLGHELRNPLSPILTALELMKLRHGDGTRERMIIERQVRHLVGLVDDLLDVSRITKGKLDLKREHIELADVIADAVETASPLLEERRHHLSISVPRHGCSIHADRARVSQVMANLLTNAAKYTEANGAIEVSASRDGESVVIAVRDNGVGIEPEMQGRVFDLFTQAGQTLDRSDGGLGLGLAIVKSLVTLHGGSVSVSSAGRDAGSTFTVRLPFVAVPEGIAAPAVTASALQLASGMSHVLIVDDNIDSAEMLAQVLSSLGYATRVAFDAAGALEAVDARVPDVALLDIGLPVMSGYELAQRFKGAPASAQMSLIAVTGYGQQSDRNATAAAGFDAHLVKPIDIEQLTKTLGLLTNRRSQSPA